MKADSLHLLALVALTISATNSLRPPAISASSQISLGHWQTPPLVAPLNGSSEDCSAAKFSQLMFDGKLTEALAEGKALVACNRRIGKPGQAMSPAELTATAMVGYWLCSNAQILAMMNKPSEAQSSLSEGTEWLKKYTDTPLVNWQAIVAETKGFLLEKQGDLATAKDVYRDCYGYCQDRLALIYLKEGKRDLARDTLAGVKTPTDYYVLGALSEASGDTKSARISYEVGIRLMGRDRPPNPQMPHYFAEHQTLVEASKRLAAK